MRNFINIVESQSGDPIEEFRQWERDNGIAHPAFLRRSFLEPNDLYIESISVPADQKGQGIGKAIMAKLMQIADAHHIPLTLEASEESEDGDWIQEWYQRLGFDYSDDGYGEYGPYMVRPAQ